MQSSGCHSLVNLAKENLDHARMLHVRSQTLLRAIQQNVIKQKFIGTTSITRQAGSGNTNVMDASAQQSETGVRLTESTKLPKRSPLVKNFFVGKVDKELLGYPEVIARDDMKRLQDEVIPLKSYFAEHQLSTQEAHSTPITPTMVEDMKQLGLYRLTVPEDFDGKGWNWSASLIASEPEAECSDLALSFLSHRVIVDVISEMGTEEQQRKFLKELGNGSLFGAEAIFEYNVPEDDYFNTQAYHNPETNSWTINGEKAYVVCNPSGNDGRTLYLVIAQTRQSQLKGQEANATTIFLIDSATTSAIEFGEVHQTFGCRGLPMRRVKFNQVHVPEDCVLGVVHEGNVVADAVLRASRLRSSMIGLGLSKKLINAITETCINNKQCGVLLKDMEIMHGHLSRATSNIYAAESMIYMTAGLLDEFEGQDVTLEVAVTKYFTQKQLLDLALRSTQIMGSKSLLSGTNSESYFRNALHLYTQGESMDTLCLFNALCGLQYAGTLMKDNVRMSRNPLFHPGHMFSKIIQTSTIDNPRSKMRLGENVHPTLEPAAQCIEHSVVRLHMCVELMFTRYGNAVVENHIDMQRISDMVTIIYSMFASIARASRSYCIGLQHADHELLLASAVCLNGREVVKNLSMDIYNGKFANNDSNLNRLAGQIVKSKGYFPVHPLTFNF